MSHSSGTKAGRYAWLALFVLCLCPCVLPFCGRLDPNATLAAVPLGSKLSELDRYLPKLNGGSSINEWRSDRPSKGAAHRTTKYGSFTVRDIGEYAQWNATKAERGAFTGELLFYHHSNIVPDDLAPSYVFSLIYVKGVLTEKDYGHLPG